MNKELRLMNGTFLWTFHKPITFEWPFHGQIGLKAVDFVHSRRSYWPVHCEVSAARCQIGSGVRTWSSDTNTETRKWWIGTLSWSVFCLYWLRRSTYHRVHSLFHCTTAFWDLRPAFDRNEALLELSHSRLGICQLPPPQFHRQAYVMETQLCTFDLHVPHLHNQKTMS